MLFPRAMSSKTSRRSGVSPGQTASNSVMGGVMSMIRVIVISCARSRLKLPARRVLAIDAQGQALRASTRLDELGKLEWTDGEPELAELGGQLRRPFVENN